MKESRNPGDVVTGLRGRKRSYLLHLARGGRGAAVLLVAGLVLAPVTTASAAGGGDELAPGGGFDDGLDPWFITDDLTATSTHGEVCVDVPGGTTTAWSSIVGVDNVPIVNGEHYDFSFTSKATTNAPIVIRALVQMPRAPWTATFEANPSVSGTETQFSYKFKSSADLPAAQLVFQIGGADEDWNFCLDNVSVKVGEPAVPFEPETNSRVRVNQVGYLADGPKRATLITEAEDALDWSLINASGESVGTGKSTPRGLDYKADENVHVIDFSHLTEPGEGYTLVADGETSYPFVIATELYGDLRYHALNYFYFARSGIEIVDSGEYTGYAREAGHVGVAPNQGDTAVGCQEPRGWTKNWTCDYTLDVTGGWYDAGDHGKYVVNGGIAVHQLMSTWERSLTAPSATPGALGDNTLVGPERDNGVPDILDEARWELEWMLKMQVPAGLPLEGMVHHKVQDDGWTGLPMLPADDPQRRQLHRPSTAATLNLAAVAAQGARLYAEYDEGFSEELLGAARTAWTAAKDNPELYAPQADGNEGGGPYDDDEVADEFYWAAAELYLSTGEAGFLTSLQSNEFHTEDLFLPGGFAWGDTAALGRMDLATVESALPGRDEVRASIVELADRYVAAQSRQAFGQPYAPSGGYTWGSNSAILNNQVVIGTAFDITGHAKYSNAVVEAMDYLLGRNAMDLSYITGYGDKYSENQHSRWFANQLDAALPHPPIGSISGGPNSDLQDPVAKQVFVSGCAPQQCYLDHINSYSTNEITVNWNSALSWVASFVADQKQIEPFHPDQQVANSVPLLPLAAGALALLLALAAGWVILRRRARAG